jgi:hypothetical protein
MTGSELEDEDVALAAREAGDPPVAAAPVGAPKEPRAAMHPLVWLAISIAWLAAIDHICRKTWHHGDTTWLGMLGVIATLVVARTVARRFRAKGKSGGWGQRWLLAAVITLLAAEVVVHGRGFLATSGTEKGANDIGLNTYAAETAFLEGKNPYSVKAQLWHRVKAGPNVTVRKDKTWLYGLEYDYGYPYFPAMFLSYVPFRPFAAGVQSVRVGTACFVVLNACLIAWLVTLATRRRPGPPAWLEWLPGLTGASLYLAVRSLTMEYFNEATTDVLVCTYGLLGFTVWQLGWPFVSGLFFGLAQASKLLPGPLFVLPLALSTRGRAAWRLLLGYALGSVVVILPWLLKNPATFTSSTILFYMTVHRDGDTTSLWYYAGPTGKHVVEMIQLVGTAGLVALGWRIPRDERSADGKERGDVAWALTLSFASFMLFTAFARMSHLNYLWCHYGLGCAALVIHMARGGEAAALTAPTASSSTPASARAPSPFGPFAFPLSIVHAPLGRVDPGAGSAPPPPPPDAGVLDASPPSAPADGGGRLPDDQPVGGRDPE